MISETDSNDRPETHTIDSAVTDHQQAVAHRAIERWENEGGNAIVPRQIKFKLPMAIDHAQPAEVIHLQPLGSKIGGTKTYTLFKTGAMEAIRLVLPAGKLIAEHRATGEITVQCLEGRVKFTSEGKPKELVAGDLLYLSAAEPHAVEAIEDSSVLVTILLGRSASHVGD